MREKSARQKDIDRYIMFLKDVKALSVENIPDNNVPFRDIISDRGVSNSVEFALKKLDVIKKENDFRWTYEWGEPTKSHALQILDFLLAWRKKKEQQPLLSDTWQTIVDQLTSISTDLKELLKPADLLISESDAKQELRNKIASSIASGSYVNHQIDANGFYDFDTVNNYILKATDDLITKLYKK